MAHANLNRVEQGSLVCKNYANHDSREELLGHENMVMRVGLVQNDGYRAKFGNLVIWLKTIGLGLVVHNVAWAEAYHRTKWHLDPSSRLATIDMGQK